MNNRHVPEDRGTPDFDFISGAFRLSDWKIPYFFTTMSLEDAATSLHLASELPGSESIQWKVEELYQRDINWPRVERHILPYLNNREQPQFFNSITIALLPFDENKQKTLPDFGSAHEWKPPNLENAERHSKPIKVGPISFGFWDNWDSYTDLGFRSGQLSWNKDQLYGVAIDGQHRLAAIKALVNNSSYITPGHKETRIPVVLLLFTPELGFSSPRGEDKTQVDLLRILFIDLNKHAQSVSRARQILLDDRDPHAVCVRQLVTRQLTDDFESLNDTPPRLPLSLVDWHTEQAKFEAGPYLTTILGLDWIVSRILETKPISDFSEYNKIATQISKLVKILDIDLTEAHKRIADHQKLELSPFSYTDGELEEIANAFGLVWAEPISRILTQFSSYKELIELRMEHKSTSLNFQHWYNLREKATKDRYEGHAKQNYRELINRFNSDTEESITETHFIGLLTEIDKHKYENLAFTVVFQKALIEAFIEYTKIKSEDIEELSYLNDEDIDFDEDYDFDDMKSHYHHIEEDSSQEDDTGLTTHINNRSLEFIHVVNGFFNQWPEVLNLHTTFEVEDIGKSEVPFWQGTLLKAEGGIDFTQGAATRAKDLIFIVAALHIYDNETEPGPGSDFDRFWDLCLSDDSPSICKRIKVAIKRYTKIDANTKSAANRILNSRGDHRRNYSEEELEERALKEAYHRIRQIWNVLDL